MIYSPSSKLITNRSLAVSCITDKDEDIETLTKFQHFECVLTVDTARRSITSNTFTAYYNYSHQLKVVQTTKTDQITLPYKVFSNIWDNTTTGNQQTREVRIIDFVRKHCTGTDYTTIVLRLLSREPPPPQISTWNSHCESLGYIVAGDSMGLSLFKL